MNQDERKAIFSETGPTLSNGDWDFSGEETQQYLHSLHSYPARFIPQIPRKAINEYSTEGQTVLDPFVGCGTTLLESVIRGRNAIGIDNNEVACLVSRAKTAKYLETDFLALDELQQKVSHESLMSTIEPDIPQYDNMEYWFDANAITELGQLRTLINALEGNAQLLAKTVFSSIIVSVSYQDSDTRYSRKPYIYQPGRAFSLFMRKLAAAMRDAKATAPLINAQATVFQKDGRLIDFIEPCSVQLIVTSPPYLNAYDYHKYHRHRLQWISGDVSMARDLEIGKHDTFTRKGATPEQYFDDMALCFSQWEKVLTDSGTIIIVIGDAIVSGKPVPVADIFIQQFEKLGFRAGQRWIRNIDTTRKSFNQKARVNQEHVIALVRK